MKKLILILAVLVVLAGISIIVFNSGQGESTNREGINEMPGPQNKDSLANRERYPVTIMDAMPPP